MSWRNTQQKYSNNTPVYCVDFNLVSRDPRRSLGPVTWIISFIGCQYQWQSAGKTLDVFRNEPWHLTTNVYLCTIRWWLTLASYSADSINWRPKSSRCRTRTRISNQYMEIEVDQLKKKNFELEEKNNKLILAATDENFSINDDVTRRDFVPRSWKWKWWEADILGRPSNESAYL